MAASLEISSLGHEMADMMRANDNGIHKCFMGGGCGIPRDDRYGGVIVQFGGTPHPARQGVGDKLRKFRGETGAGIRYLLPFQVEAVLNMAFRPTRTSVWKTVVRTYAENTRLTQQGTYVLATPDDDVGMMAINDLFTGSGKTLTTILGAILFAEKRRREIVDRVPFLMREQSYANWSTRVQCPMSNEQKRPVTFTPTYTNVVVVMCAKHLFSQWKSACASALRILGMDGVSVLENPLPGSADLQTDSLKIVLLHSAPNLFRLNLEFVPVVVVDEFTIKSASNVLTKASELLPLFGRLLLVSADAGSVEGIIVGAHRRSFLRKMIKWDDITYRGDVHVSMVAGIPLISASVLQTVERGMVGDFMINQLKKVRYEKFTVKYTPSLASRLFGNNFEMSAISGSRLIHDRFGIVLTGTKTIWNLLIIVKDTVDALRATDSRSRTLADLVEVMHKLEAFVGEKEACPICLEEYEMASGASIINPCWHIVCDRCLRGMMAAKHHKCPMCRTRIEGHTTALVDDGHGDLSSGSDASIHASGNPDPNPNLSLLGNMNAILQPTAGLDKACIDTLRCIRADVGLRPYKIVMIVPDEHFFTKFAVDVREKLSASDVQIIEFKTSGTKRKHVTGKMVTTQIESFASDSGPPIKILFTTEGKTDSLTGLDFPRVDCILSLGDGNSLQRLGRLTRLPRMMNRAISRKTVRYICLEPVL